MHVTSRLCVLVGATVLSACAGNSAPAGFLPSPQAAQSQAWGGWIELQYTQGQSERFVAGELIAVSRDTVWVLGPSGGAVVPTASVRGGQLTGYSAQADKVAGAAFLGTLSTISNGWFLVFTAPLWIITGTVAAANQSHAPVRRVPPLAWSDLSALARFPQGLPVGVRLEALRSRPP